MQEPLASSWPAQFTVKFARLKAGKLATLLVGAPASIVLKIGAVASELWSDRPALKYTVA